MKNKTLAFSISLLLGSPASYALTPWTDKAPDVAIYTSGASVQDKAYGEVIIKTLAAPNSVDYFADVNPTTGTAGARWTAYYFIGNDNLGSGLAGKKILLEKRAVGSSGYGVVPLLASIPLEHLNILSTKASDWTADAKIASSWGAKISSENAKKFLFKRVSDAGFSGNDPAILLKPNTLNYPEQVKELMTGKFEPNWPQHLNSFGGDVFSIVPTGGTIYGAGVTLDLYKVLQAAQKRAGTLPSTVKVGDYNESDLPNLNRNVMASLLAGKIGAWEQFKIVDKTDDNKVKSLLDKSILDDAGVTAPSKESTTGENLTPVALATRNNGAAAIVVAYAKFLNYPTTANSFSPVIPVKDSAVVEDASLPIVKAPKSLADSGTILNDWQNGTNTLGFNNVTEGTGFAKRWGLAINSVDRNTAVKADGTGGDPWRYIKIDGYAPTLENVAAGVYPIWTEGAAIYQNTKSIDPQWASKVKLLKSLTENWSSPAVIGAFTTTQAWGKTGAFVTTADPRGFVTSIPFDASNPVVPFTHNSGSGTHAEIVPVADANAKGGLEIQLK
ncbi:MAG: hypothetical protein PHN45_10185 [Methylococcales bacterium]|nr:hypothetical protein [Methylococcales bacterium]MDD5755107.1 hypothetical protein [Methylococcales bacterium]